MLLKDYYCKGSFGGKKSLVVGLKGLDATSILGTQQLRS
jgi:hypothetical protein